MFVLPPTRKTTGPPRDGRARPAFTLVEVVLALALLSVLLAALYSAFDLYSRLSSAGREQAERAQLARAILQEMRTDLQSVVYRQPESDSAADDTTTSEDDAASAGSTTPLGAATAATAPGLDLVGDAQNLTMYVSRPRRPMDIAMFGQSGHPADSAELLSASWFLASANAPGLQGAVGNLAAGGSTTSSRETGVQGLARLEGDRLTLDALDTAGDFQSMANYARVIAPEVKALQFRYFDGAAWFDTWDTAASGALPQAIEITLGFGKPESDLSSDQDRLSRLGIEPISETFRTVVRLPLARPPATAAGSSTTSAGAF